jgi:hypothetical protein
VDKGWAVSQKGGQEMWVDYVAAFEEGLKSLYEEPIVSMTPEQFKQWWPRPNWPVRLWRQLRCAVGWHRWGPDDECLDCWQEGP